MVESSSNDKLSGEPKSAASTESATSEANSESSNKLEQLMADEMWIKESSAGSAEALTRFYETLLESEVIVPDRSNMDALTGSVGADFPRASIPWFAVKGKVEEGQPGADSTERNIIPIFCSATGMELWCSRQLNHSVVFFKSLLQSVPNDWWLCLNPGSDLEKEFSPWEISLLKQGLDALPEIIADWQDQQENRSANVEPLSTDKYPLVIKCLKDFGNVEKRVRAISALLETSQTEDGESRSILIGCEVSSVSETELTELTDRLNSSLRLTTIGEDPFRVFTSSDEHPDPFFSIFNYIPAVFEREDEST